MTARTPPWALQAGSHPAEHVRQSKQGVFGSPFGAFAGGVQPSTGGGGHGVVGATDLLVAAHGTPNMSVDVAGGLCAIRGTESAHQGVYGPCYNDASVNLVISTADGSNPRNDLIVAKIRDAAYSGASNDFSLAVVTGTPNASPVDPSVPANALVLARVRVDAAVGSIVAGKITDLRLRASALNAPIFCTSTTRPTGAALYQGLTIYEIDTKNVLEYDGTNWTGAHNVGMGRIASMTVTAAQLIANSTSDFGSTAILNNVPVLANRRTKVTFKARGAQSNVAADVFDFKLQEDSAGNFVDGVSKTPAAANGPDGFAIISERSGLTAGLHSWQIVISRAVGSGTGGFVAAAAFPATFLVEDIGGV